MLYLFKDKAGRMYIGTSPRKPSRQMEFIFGSNNSSVINLLVNSDEGNKNEKK